MTDNVTVLQDRHDNQRKAIIASLETLSGAETLARDTLTTLSREILSYVIVSNDIEMATRCVNTCKTSNRDMVALFFEHFLPWDVEKTEDKRFVKFGKKIKSDKKRAAKLADLTAFLADSDNNIWTFAKTVAPPKPPKKKDLAKMVGSAIDRAIEGDIEKGGITPPLSKMELFAAIMGKVSASDLVSFIAHMEDNMGQGAQPQPMRDITPRDEPAEADSRMIDAVAH